MRVTNARWKPRALAVHISLIFVLLFANPQLQAQTTAGKKGRDGDRAAIRKLSQKLEQLYKKGDAKSIANLWTENGELINVDGERITGRMAIAKKLAETFKEHKERIFEAKTTAIRFPSKYTAMETGTVTTRFGKLQKPIVTRYSILHVRENGKWRFALVREWEVETPESGLQDIAWLIGRWSSQAKETQVHFSFKWSKGKAFILGDFSIREGKKVVASGKQIIGRDPVQNVLRYWVFLSDGSYGHGVWAKDGKRWAIDTVSKLADGRQADASNILTPLSKNAFTWQSINRAVDEASLPDTAPIKVSRVKSNSK